MTDLPPGAAMYFDAEGQPTKEYSDRWDAVARCLPNFDGWLILESLLKNWSVAETVHRGKEVEKELDEMAAAFANDFEFQLDHDMSMNY